jgi:nitrite reductase/ring-hydroxylating ferredoxin subunit
MTSAAQALRVMPDARRLGEGQGVRFRVTLDGVERPAFAVRWRGRVYGYLNTCRHLSHELDFGDAHFFDDAYDALVCCHHGARYQPETGACMDGPCGGGRLTPLVMEEQDGALWCLGRMRDPDSRDVE